MIQEYAHSSVDKTILESQGIMNTKIKWVVISEREGRGRGCDQVEA